MQALLQSQPPSKVRMLPDKRWCLAVALCCTSESEVFRLRNANEPPASCDEARVRFAVEMEGAIHKAASDFCDYASRATRVLHAIVNGAQLWRVPETPDQIAAARMFDFLQGTIVDKIRMQFEGHEKVFKMMIQERFEELEKETQGNELLQCEKCHSSNVIFDLRQVTRPRVNRIPDPARADAKRGRGDDGHSELPKVLPLVENVAARAASRVHTLKQTVPRQPASFRVPSP